MLPIPIMSTETLESCAEIGHTKAARTCAEHKTRFIMRQTGRVESLKVRFLVGPVIALFQRHLSKWASLRSRIISARLPMMVIAHSIGAEGKLATKKVRLGRIAATLSTVSQCWNSRGHRQMGARRRPRLVISRP